MKAEFTVALLAAAMLCVSAMAQENTAEDWFSKGQELQRNDSHEEALQAYEKAIQVDPESASAWMSKGNALLSLKRYNESMEA
ncbi:MAG TPA: tetratricopeptide repeat protein, partial [Methanothrix sp.]|nr:tetratricopeptide repeat protein [Methanothrix sp.]